MPEEQTVFPGGWEQVIIRLISAEAEAWLSLAQKCPVMLESIDTLCNMCKVN